MTARVSRYTILLLAVLGIPGVASAVELHFNPQTVYADSAEVFAVTVEAIDVDSLGGFSLALSYDAAILAFVDAEPGGLFSNYSPPYGLFWSLNQEAGLITVEAYIIPVDECVAGPGAILDLWFEAIGQREETILHIAAATVRNCQGVPIEPIEVHDANIVVGPMAELFFEPDPEFIFGTGHTGEVALSIDDTPFVRGFQVRLSYDPTIVQFDSALVGSLISNPETTLWWLVEEESDALIRIEGIILGPGLYVDGPGALADLHFTGLAEEGSTDIVFEEWHVWDVAAAEFYPVAIDTGLIILDGSLAEAGDGRAGSQTFGDDSPVSLDQRANRADGICALRLRDANPGADFRLSFSAPLGAQVNAQVADVCGRILCDLRPVQVADRQWTVHWSGRTDDDRRAPAGVYFIRLASGSARAACRVVRTER